jgi:putative DNA primase/helicase
MDFNNIPDEIKKMNNWVLWKLENREDKHGKIKACKPPYQTNGKNASHTNKKTWTNFESVLETFNHRGGVYSGIGFVLDGTGYSIIDLDHIGEEGSISEEDSNHIINSFNSYTEKSQSGKGIHIIVKGSIPRAVKTDIEIYSTERYFALTGDLCGVNKDIEERQEELTKLFEKHKTKDEPKSVKSLGEKMPKPKSIEDAAHSNNDLLEKAFSSKEGSKIRALYHGDLSSYDNDHSKADQALCNYLAFWFNKDWDDIDSTFKNSSLYRAKWDREDYKAATIDRAISGCNKSYQELREQIPVSKTQTNKNNTNVVKYYDLNDYGNGQRLVDTYKDNIRFCNEWKSWMIYNGYRWIEDTYGALERMSKTIIEQIRDEALKEEDEKKQKVLLGAVSKTGNMRGIKGMIESASSEKVVRISSDTFDQNKYLLNFKNGTYDLNENKFKSNKADDYMTKLVVGAYDPNASCPRWEQFISEVMGENKNLIEFVQRAIGYSLTGSTKEQKMFICYGAGSNGKSLMMEILRNILNDYSRNIAAESLMIKDNKSGASGDIARLKGARFVTAKENKEGRKLDEALIKEATGADTITARYLYKNEFEFIPEFKLWLATNHKPEITGQDDGIWRRLVLIPFNVQFTDDNGNKDPDLLDKLKTEIPGIINWCINGCAMWMQEGLKEPNEVIAAVEEYRSESDSLQQFIDECLVINPNACITNKDLTDLYNRWSGSNITTTKFSLMFKDRAKRIKVTQTRKNYGTFWQGIGKSVREDFKEERFA